MATVSWEETEQGVESIEDLEKLLDKLHAEAARGAPIMASVALQPSGDSLTIGLGLDVSVLNFVSGSGDPPYFTSRAGAEPDGVVCFRFMGDLSEFPMRQAVPMAAARRAVRYFWTTGVRDPEMMWEEV